MTINDGMGSFLSVDITGGRFGLYANVSIVGLLAGYAVLAIIVFTSRQLRKK